MKNILYFLLPIILLTYGKMANAQAFAFAPGQLSYTENFDGMGSAGVTFLNGWTAIRFEGTGTVGATLAMAVTDGTSNSGNVYNVGAASSEERAFGTLASGSTVPRFGAFYANNTGASITKIDMQGIMEQWRSGSNAALNEIVKFEYSLDATDLQTGTWTAVSSFDLLEKITASAEALPLDGNSTDNQTNITATITGINWTSGSNLWIRWSDANDIGSDGIMAIDDLEMIVTTGIVVTLPEPTNYPTSFLASGKGSGIAVTWTDATGAQVPSAYLLKISSTDNFTAPVDGTFTPEDLDFTDGSGAKTIAQGIQEYVFSGLNYGTTYYVKIFPYTNAGTAVDYKTDGTAPTANSKTQALLYKQDFETGFLAPWTEFSVLGEQTWVTDTISENIFAKMSGYVSSAGLPNEDWLISPQMVLPAGSSPKLEFRSATKFGIGTDGIMLQLSTNYTGGDPNINGDWNDVTNLATLSSGNFVWASSGYIDLTGYESDNFHIAFTYTCGTENVPTWEFDNIVVTKNAENGIFNNPKINNLTSIYPNPCTDVFSVRTPSAESYLVSVFSSQGTKLIEQEINQSGSFIKTSSLSTGIYMVSVINLESNVREMHKLVVK